VAIYLGALGAASGAIVFASAIIYVNWIAIAQRGALTPTSILIAAFVVVSPGLWAQAYLVAAGRPYLYMRGSAVGAGLATALALVLAPRFGAAGSATAHALGLLLTTALAIWSARYLLRETGAQAVSVGPRRRLFGRST
jgi:O-antigen/teichoic acid export membrane protein